MVVRPHGLTAFRQALEGGARIEWDERRIKGSHGALAGLREEPEATRAIMRRAEVFHAALQQHGAQLPILTIPHKKRSGHGTCYSCGETHVNGGRCPACAIAVYLALNVMPPEELWVGVETGA